MTASEIVEAVRAICAVNLARPDYPSAHNALRTIQRIVGTVAAEAPPVAPPAPEPTMTLEQLIARIHDWTEREVDEQPIEFICETILPTLERMSRPRPSLPEAIEHVRLERGSRQEPT